MDQFRSSEAPQHVISSPQLVHTTRDDIDGQVGWDNKEGRPRSNSAPPPSTEVEEEDKPSSPPEEESPRQHKRSASCSSKFSEMKEPSTASMATDTPRSISVEPSPPPERESPRQHKRRWSWSSRYSGKKEPSTADTPPPPKSERNRNEEPGEKREGLIDMATDTPSLSSEEERESPCSSGVFGKEDGLVDVATDTPPPSLQPSVPERTIADASLKRSSSFSRENMTRQYEVGVVLCWCGHMIIPFSVGSWNRGRVQSY